MNKIKMLIGGLLLSSPILAASSTSNETAKYVDFGSGRLTDNILEPIVDILFETSQPVIKLLIIISIALIVLDLTFAGLNALMQEKYTNFAANVINKVVNYIFYIYIMSNWFTGHKIFEKFVFKPMFITFPNYLVGQPLNLDIIWDQLMSMPNTLYSAALYLLSPISFIVNGWLILLLLLMALILYIQILFLFVRVVTSMLHIILISMFAFITFPLNFFDKLSTRYGGVMIKTYLVLTLQYSVLYIIVKNMGDVSGYIFNTVYGGGIIFNIVAAPILGFVISALMFMLVKFTNTALDMVANISNNM